MQTISHKPMLYEITQFFYICIGDEIMKKTYIDKDFTGKRNGRLTVLHKADYGKTKWVCKCDCGNEVTLTPYYFNRYKSCGCLEKENKKNLTAHTKTHGKTNTILYHKYRGMKERCYNKNYYRYDRYGGRGIKICDEWLGEHGFDNFYKWAIDNGYDDNKKGYDQTLDRIDVDEDYSPDNCRWVNQKQQMRNYSKNVYVEYKGEKILLCEFCETHGITYSSYVTRNISRGLSVDELLLNWKANHDNAADTMTIREAAKYYKVCEETIYNWIRSGLLDAKIYSNKWRIKRGQERPVFEGIDKYGRFKQGYTRKK